MTLPSRAEMACMRPSQVPAKRTPGIAVIAAACEGLHEFRFSHGGGGTDQMVFPFAISNAETPPLESGFFASKFWFAAKRVSPSSAAPHMTPPLRLFPICACHSVFPSLSGSRPYMADLFAATMICRPSFKLARIGDDAKSTSGASASGHVKELRMLGRPQLRFQISFAVT